MISKELLNLLGYGTVISSIEPTFCYNMDCITFTTETMTDDGRGAGRNILIRKTYVISVETIAAKCKSWLISNHICVSSGNGLLKNDGFYCSVDGFVPFDEHIEYSPTEPEAIYAAAEWVRSNVS